MRRYVPGVPFPPYAFVPGHFPHPRSAPEGHSHGQPELPVTVLDAQGWWACQRYLLGIDLFNHGYYWEAHEAWEGPWREAGRVGPIAALLKGLIRLSAAGVKARQGDPQSVRSHATAALQQFLGARQALGRPVLCGLDLGALAELAHRIGSDPGRWRGDPSRPVQVVFDRVLTLGRA